MANVTATRNQHRATCPACFAQQAVNSRGQLVNHGYKRPQMWHSNVGTCSGAGVRHFGTPEGRDATAAIAERMREQAARMEAEAPQVLAGAAPVMTTKRVATGVVMTVVMDNPDSYDRRQYAARLQASAVQLRRNAEEFDKLVAAWTPAEPVQVVVAASAGPLVHFYSSYYNGKACASSRMGAMKGYYVRDLKDVTCERCKAKAARMAERAAQQQKVVA